MGVHTGCGWIALLSRIWITYLEPHFSLEGLWLFAQLTSLLKGVYVLLVDISCTDSILDCVHSYRLTEIDELWFCIAEVRCIGCAVQHQLSRERGEALLYRKMIKDLES